MEALKMVPMVVLMLAITGIILGAALITTGEFGDTITQCWNSSYAINGDAASCNSTGPAVGSIGTNNLNLSNEYYGIAQANAGLGVVAEQQNTIAIIAVMTIIISLIAGVFVYFTKFR